MFLKSRKGQSDLRLMELGEETVSPIKGMELRACDSNLSPKLVDADKAIPENFRGRNTFNRTEIVAAKESSPLGMHQNPE